MERPLGDTIFDIAILDHPDNANHPAGWRVDEQGLINPAISLLADWSLKSGQERRFRYEIVIYQGPCQAEILNRHFKDFAGKSSKQFALGAVRTCILVATVCAISDYFGRRDKCHVSVRLRDCCFFEDVDRTVSRRNTIQAPPT
jgi:hypothetical protein